jgi:hypothetical protein
MSKSPIKFKEASVRLPSGTTAFNFPVQSPAIIGASPATSILEPQRNPFPNPPQLHDLLPCTESIEALPSATETAPQSARALERVNNTLLQRLDVHRVRVPASSTPRTASMARRPNQYRGRRAALPAGSDHKIPALFSHELKIPTFSCAPVKSRALAILLQLRNLGRQISRFRFTSPRCPSPALSICDVLREQARSLRLQARANKYHNEPGELFCPQVTYRSRSGLQSRRENGKIRRRRCGTRPGDP